MKNQTENYCPGKSGRRRFIIKTGFVLPAYIFPFFRLLSRTIDTMDKNLNNSGDINITGEFEPSYLKLHHTGELKERGKKLWDMMGKCRLCPRNCLKNRLEGRRGKCEATARLQISSYHPHFGEESQLVGQGGSGTIFFTHCNLRCVFCLNWEISIGGEGLYRNIEELAKMMLNLQESGCLNINVVTPTHYSPHIILALDIAARKGLRLPLVYNTSGYENLEVLQILDGIVDIYLPDFKYFDGAMANKFSFGAENYPEVTRKALLEMHRQVGVARPGANGMITRGLMIRHLVMPHNVSGTDKVVHWIANHLSRDTYINLMSQYRPMYKAAEYHEISRPLQRKEYEKAVISARNAGLTNLKIQGFI